MREEKLEEHGSVKYPWDKWTDGEEHHITHGTDFTCTIPGMRAQLVNKCKLRGLADRMIDGKLHYCRKVRTTVNGNTITFQYIWDEIGEDNQSFTPVAN